MSTPSPSNSVPVQGMVNRGSWEKIISLSPIKIESGFEFKNYVTKEWRLYEWGAEIYSRRRYAKYPREPLYPTGRSILNTPRAAEKNVLSIV